MAAMDAFDFVPFETDPQQSGSERGFKRPWSEETDAVVPAIEKRQCTIAPTDHSFPPSQWHGDDFNLEWCPMPDVVPAHPEQGAEPDMIIPFDWEPEDAIEDAFDFEHFGAVYSAESVQCPGLGEPQTIGRWSCAADHFSETNHFDITQPVNSAQLAPQYDTCFGVVSYSLLTR